LSSSKVFTRIYTWISEIKILTDKSLIFSNFEETKTFKFNGSTESVELDKEMEKSRLTQISIVVSGNTEVYYRSYKKLLDIITEIGGFFNCIKFIVYIILFLYSKNTIMWHCISSIISEQEILDGLNRSLIEKNVLKPEIIRVEAVRNSNIENIAEQRKEKNLGIHRPEDNRPEDSGHLENSRSHLPINNNSIHIKNKSQFKNNHDNSIQ